MKEDVALMVISEDDSNLAVDFLMMITTFHFSALSTLTMILILYIDGGYHDSVLMVRMVRVVKMMMGRVVKMRMGMFTEAMVMPVQRLLPRHVIHCKLDFIWQRKIASRLY